MRKIILILFAIFLCTEALAWDSGAWNAGFVPAGLIGNGVARGGASDMASSSTAIPLNYALIKKTYANGVAEAGTLADGIQGQVIKIVIVCQNGSGSYVLTPTTKTGFSSITFDAYNEQATLLFLDNTNGWIVIGSSGATLNN